MTRVPTPPAPPRTRMDLPAEKPALSRPSWAVSMASGRPAACAKSMLLGLSATSFSSTAVYSASEPNCLGPSRTFSLMWPYTSSPSLRFFTWLPTLTTTPAMSYPGTVCRPTTTQHTSDQIKSSSSEGSETEGVPGLTGSGESVALNLPIRRLESTGLSAAAATRTSTWSSPTAGTDTASSSLSTLASPYSSYAQAFIVPGTSVAAVTTAGDDDAAVTTLRPGPPHLLAVAAALVLAAGTEDRRNCGRVAGRGKKDLEHGFVRIE
uniref:Uncharacterized protein n=1 Tax=Aegilops tauschii subsp. strangulata TaxID=200361 RepID=A0A453NES6_AEGTS